MYVDLMEKADRQILNAIFNTLPTKVSEDFFLTCKFHSHCGHSCSTILELVKFIGDENEMDCEKFVQIGTNVHVNKLNNQSTDTLKSMPFGQV